jgi:hypothetical protein
MRRHLSVPLSLSSLLLATVLAVAFAVPAGAGSADAEQIADDAALTLDDVPDGFTEETPDDEDQEFDAPSCTAIRKAAKLIDKAPNAETEFGAESGEAFANISNKVAVLTNVKRAKAVFAAYAGSKTADCLEEAYAAAFAARDPDAEVSVTVEEFDPDAGDSAVGYAGQVSTGTGDGFYYEMVFVRVGRAVDGFFFVNTTSPPPSDDTVVMVETGVSRLSDSLTT